MTQQRGRKVLVIDDSEVCRDLERALLADAGFDVRVAGSVLEFDGILRQWAPEIVLTDVDMPDISGPELCRVLKARFGELVPIVLCSGLPEDELASLARACGADAFLSKANGLEQLPRGIAELCEEILW